MYQPALGSGLVISLPGETVRAEVARVVDRHTVVVELLAPLLNPARQHQYRVGDIICCRRAWGELGESWEVVEERNLAPVPKPKRKAVRKFAKAIPPKAAKSRTAGLRQISKKKNASS